MRGERAAVDRLLDPATVITTVERLLHDRRYRDDLGLYFVEGVRNVVQAVDYQYPVHSVIYSDRLLTAPVARMIVRRLKRAGIPHVNFTPEQFRRVSCAEHASGVGLLLRQRVLRIHDLGVDAAPCWVALGVVRSPGNLGTLIRTAAAVGAGGFILLDDSVDPYDPAVVRASMGPFYRQRIVRGSVSELRRWARDRALPIVGASPDGSVDYDRVRYVRPTILLLGEERAGLTNEQRTVCERIVRIPMVDGTDSLNLAVAGSLLLYQVYRDDPRRTR